LSIFDTPLARAGLHRCATIGFSVYYNGESEIL
jgi:hypothetical protein